MTFHEYTFATAEHALAAAEKVADVGYNSATRGNMIESTSCPPESMPVPFLKHTTREGLLQGFPPVQP